MTLRAALSPRLIRRLEAGERAALDASLDDPRLEPRRIYEAAAALYRPLGGTFRGDELARHIELFGVAQIQRMFSLGGEPPMAPARVQVRLSARPSVAIVGVQLRSRISDPEVVVRVETRAKSWPADKSYAIARVLDSIARLPSYGVAVVRGCRSHLIETFWVLQPDQSGAWKVTSVEPWMSGRHHLRGDPTGEEDRLDELRAESVRELESERGTQRIPDELASNLPDDQQLAADELAMVDGRFDRELIRASVEEIAELWAEACDGAPDSLMRVTADPDVARKLLASVQLLKDPRVGDMRVSWIHKYRTPPQITVTFELRAWRGPRDSENWSGLYGVTRTDECCWRLQAGPSAEHPWLLVDPEAYPAWPGGS